MVIQKPRVMADTILVQGASWRRRLLARVALLTGLAGAMALSPSELGLPFTTLPVLVLFFVVYLGGHGGASDDSFAENFTDAQDKALRAMIAQLQSAHGENLHLSGHNEYAAKACPCFDVHSLHG